MSDKIKGLLVFLICGSCATIAWFISGISQDFKWLATIILALESALGLFIFLRYQLKASKARFKAVDELTLEEIAGMRVEAAKESLGRFLETDDFQKLLLHEKIYFIIHKFPLSGPSGDFRIGAKASAEMAELINKFIELR